MLDGIKEESVGFLFNLEVKSKEEQDAEAKAKQDEAEAKALAAAQEGTARVLARQAAEAKLAAQGRTAAAPSAPSAPSAPTPAAVNGTSGNGAATPTARRSGTAKPSAAAAAAAPAPVAPKPTGTGPALDVKGLEAPRRSADQLTYSAPTLDGSPAESGKAKAAKSATVSGTKETPRNAPCPCGSGKKYKQCHGSAANN
jgi:preprotein translocase subunit SecA